ncbi:hypothetical protein LRY60_03700 [Candidatus Woesebacteria bacterium]|nr:hypothetical protein [Candidatus Woesebacteria bacterium]MCD8546191.1 hypothetical protein [Candidatus Woesebacteria bacterium]
MSASWIFKVAEILILASLLVLLPGRSDTTRSSRIAAPEVEAAELSTASGELTVENAQ